jgi:hypothetical protein
MKWMWIGGIIGGLLAIVIAAFWVTSDVPGATVFGGALGGGLAIAGMVLGGMWGTRERG